MKVQPPAVRTRGRTKLSQRMKNLTLMGLLLQRSKYHAFRPDVGEDNTTF
jgi:hypothetical protein